MKDETYVYISDVKDKKATARSARHMRTHCGKGGRVRLPSDYLTKKELMKMSGECKSYRLNDPMAWKEFKSLPDDIKITYVKLLRQKFNAPGRYIAEMLGINYTYYSKEINRLGISEGKNCRGRCTPWDKEGFYAWWHGVDQVAAPVPEAPIESDHIEDQVFCHEDGVAYVEDDLPYEEPDPIPCDNVVAVQIPVTAIPINGSMNFNCPANQALNTLAQVLGDAKVSISVMWRVVEEDKGGMCDGNAT